MKEVVSARFLFSEVSVSDLQWWWFILPSSVLPYAHTLASEFLTRDMWNTACCRKPAV